MIKPCPLCGSNNIMVGVDDNLLDEWSVQCANCDCQISEIYSSRDGIIEAWNNRPREDELLSIIKRFVLAINNPIYSKLVREATDIIDKYEGGE